MASLFPNEKEFDETQVEGICEKIHYKSEENHFRILGLRLQDERLITVTGKFGPIHIGERLKIKGEYVQHDIYGLRYEAKEFELLLPKSSAEVQKFLSSGFIPGIGKKMAKLLVDHHGPDILRILSEEPEKLSDTPGIGQKRLEAILKSWQEKVEDRELQIVLRGWGLTERMVNEVKLKFGSQRLTQIKDNPYILAQRISGITFKRADEIGKILGFEEKSPKRILSSARYFLKKALEEGHSYLPFSELLEKMLQYLKIPIDELEPILLNLCEEEHLILLQELDLPCYLPHYYKLEQFIATYLLDINQELKTTIEVEALEKILENLSQLSIEQKEILNQMVNQKFAVLTGGPGVGKTTIIKALYEIFQQQDLKICLAAPTGRAAKRMEAATSVSTQTVHRLLKIRPEQMSFEKAKHQEEKLPADVLIIDECSMLDLELFSLLLCGIGPDTRLYLVGDSDQLPSVGAGNLLADILNSQAFPTFRLTKIFRQKQQSSIVLNAHQILNGKALSPDQGNEGEFYIIKQDDHRKILTMLLEMLTDRIPRQFQLEPKNIQILCPMKKGKIGTNTLNQEIQKKFQKSKIIHGFCVGDKVMQIRNNYDKDVFNGDIGLVTEINALRVKVDFRNRIVEYRIPELNELQLAYAISIHKSQGSEFSCVIIPLGMEQYTMLQRNLLYTAVTRGKSLVILIGDPRALSKALNDNHQLERYTHLETFIREKKKEIVLMQQK